MTDEGYSGVKFKTLYNTKASPVHHDNESLIKWCGIFHEYGLAPPYSGGSYGNLSYRTGKNTFIITGTCIGLKGNLDNSCFVEVLQCDPENKEILVNGIRPPSSESFLHDIIYQHRSDIHAVFHGHHQKITCSAGLLGIPLTSKKLPYGTPELAQSVIKLLDHDFFIIREHGFVSLGKNMETAGNQTLIFLEKLNQYLIKP